MTWNRHTVFAAVWLVSVLAVPQLAYADMIIEEHTRKVDKRLSRGFEEIVSVDLKLPGEGPGWVVIVTGTATHWNANFRLTLYKNGQTKPAEVDPWTWGSGTGNDWDVQTQQHAFQNVQSGTYQVRLEGRCFIKCKVASGRIVALALRKD